MFVCCVNKIMGFNFVALRLSPEKRMGSASPVGMLQREGRQEGDTYGFHHPSCESPRFLLASACHRTETRQRNGHIVDFSVGATNMSAHFSLTSFTQHQIICYTYGLAYAGATLR